jgi:hypothetical protein|nr:MAG: hypothetical protein [Lake Baikal virophage 4]
MQNDVFSLDDIATLSRSIKGVQIDWCGVWTIEGSKGKPCNSFSDDDLKNIQQAIKEIPKVFVKTRGQQKGMSSYTGKHVLEHYRETNSDGETEYKYISNGCFMIAMMHKGYVPKLMRKGGKNCYSPNVCLNAREQEGRRIPSGVSC